MSQGTAAQHSRRVLDILDLITKRLDDVTETKDLVRELLHWSKEHEAKFHGPGSSVGDNADDLYNAQEQNKDPVPNVPIEDFLGGLRGHLLCAPGASYPALCLWRPPSLVCPSRHTLTAGTRRHLARPSLREQGPQGVCERAA